jgi:hypothetical protein
MPSTAASAPLASGSAGRRMKVRMPVKRGLCVASGRIEPVISVRARVANTFCDVKHGQSKPGRDYGAAVRGVAKHDGCDASAEHLCRMNATNKIIRSEPPQGQKWPCRPAVGIHEIPPEPITNFRQIGWRSIPQTLLLIAGSRRANPGTRRVAAGGGVRTGEAQSPLRERRRRAKLVNARD